MRRFSLKFSGRTLPRGAQLVLLFCLLLALAAAVSLVADTLTLHRAGDADQAVVAEGVAALEEEAQRELPNLRGDTTDPTGNDDTENPSDQEEPSGTDDPAGNDDTETPSNQEDPSGDDEPDTPTEEEPLVLTAEQESVLALDLSTVTKTQIAQRLSNAAVVGDSTAYAVLEYNLLDTAHVFAKIGVSLSKADEQFEACIQAYPEMVILLFGENDLELYGSRVNRFTEAYQERLEQLASELPNAEVYAISVLPVQEGVAAENENYQYISEYNAALEALCAETGAHYVDAGFLLKAKPELYDADGIHPKANFYLYLFTYLADMAGL